MSIFSLIKANKGNMALAGLAGATLVFLGLVFFANDFSVRTDYLVIQKSADKQDFYTLSKSVEYSGNILKEAVASDLFFKEAVGTGSFSASAFPSNERERLKEWRKSITVSQRSGAGILSVEVSRKSQAEATGIARAVSQTLIEKNDMFRSGEKDSITIKTISGPIVEQNPTPKTLVAGVIAGAIAGMALVLLYAASRQREEYEVSSMKYEGGEAEEEHRELPGERELELYRQRILSR